MKTSFQLQLSSSTSSSGCNSIRWSPAASFSGLKTPALFRLKMIVKFCTPCRRAHEKQRAGSCSRVLEQECMFLNGFSCVDEKQMQSNSDLIMINHGSVAQAPTRACAFPSLRVRSCWVACKHLAAWRPQLLRRSWNGSHRGLRLAQTFGWSPAVL